MAIYPWTKGHQDRGIDRAGFPHFMRWFEAMECRSSVDIFDTRDNAERLARATGH